MLYMYFRKAGSCGLKSCIYGWASGSTYIPDVLCVANTSIGFMTVLVPLLASEQYCSETPPLTLNHMAGAPPLQQ